MTSPLILLGYMGCGKTKIGRRLSKKLSIDFIDLDHEIESHYLKTISQLFNDFGEIGFREIERKILLKILDKNGTFILSLGGGTPCYFDNMEMIQKKTDLSFYINLDSKVLAKRLFTRKQTRPLIKSIESEQEMLIFVNKHLFERNLFYQKARYIIDCGENDIKKTCKSIIQILEKNSF